MCVILKGTFSVEIQNAQKGVSGQELKQGSEEGMGEQLLTRAKTVFTPWNKQKTLFSQGTTVRMIHGQEDDSAS